MLPKAAIPIGSSPPAWEIAASAPPVTTASQRPSPTRRKALPMAWVAEAHAVTTVSHGPRRPKRIEIAAAPAFAIIIGTSRGETRRGPLAMRRIDLFLDRRQAPGPRAEDDADARRVGAELAGVGERHRGRGDRELGEAVGLARLFRVEPPRRVEGADPLGADGRRARQAGEEGVLADAAGREDAEARHDDAAPGSPLSHSFETTSS